MSDDRMRDATWRPVPDETRAAHLAAIQEAVEGAPAPVTPITRPRRRWTVVAVAAALLVLPAGIAVAAEGALPGDALYSVKKVTEKIRSLVDEDVVAEHRIEELEQLVATDAPAEVIAEQVDRAAIEVDRLDPKNDLHPRFASATEAVNDMPGRDEDVVADPPIVTDTTAPPDATLPTTDTTVPTTDTTVPTIDTTIPTTDTTVAITPDRTTTTVVTSTTTPPIDVVTTRVFGVVRAGPTCPVQRFPIDPACEDQPVSGAVVVIADADGKEITRVETNPEGRFDVRLPAGSYLLIPQPHDGLLGTADQQLFEVADAPLELLVGYDTGIR